MSEEKEDTSGAGEQGLTADDVKRLIAEALGQREPKGRPAGRVTAAEQGDSVAEQVSREVARIKEKEASEAAAKATDERLAALEAAKQVAADPPKALRGISQRLWGDR